MSIQFRRLGWVKVNGKYILSPACGVSFDIVDNGAYASEAGMNPLHRISGYSKGIETYFGNITAKIPLKIPADFLSLDDIDWNVDNIMMQIVYFDNSGNSASAYILNDVKKTREIQTANFADATLQSLAFIAVDYKKLR